MELNKKTKKAGILVTTITVLVMILIVIFASGIFNQTSAPPDFPKEHLYVDATYLLKTNETNNFVDVICTPYLTNIWEKESGEIKVIAYVIELNNNLAVYKNSVDIGKISADSTAEIEIPVVLSNNSYKVDILIFEDGKLVIKGKLTISAHPVYDWDKIPSGRSQSWFLTNSIGEFDQLH